MSTPPRMRTIKETIAELKQIDPQTAITEYYLRDLVNSGQIVFVKAGNKTLINFDKFLEFLSEPKSNIHTCFDKSPIRRVV